MRTIDERERVELERLGESIAAVSAEVDSLTRRLLGELREFDRREGWALSGALSCAQWLSWRTGLAPGAARERVRVARRLGELPAVEAALERGELTYSKVRAMTRVATAENEATLVELGTQMTAAQLEQTCRRLEQAAPRTPDAAAMAEQQRSVIVRRRADGLVVLEVCLPADEAEGVLAAIDASADGIAGRRTAEGPRGVSAGTRRADGLVAMAERVLRGGGAEGGPPVEIVVTVDAATGTGQTGGGDGLDREVVRRLCCDAGVVPVVMDGQGRPMDAGRRRRTIPARLRRALVARDRGCQFPGCTNHRWVDGHHVRHWLDGGATNLDNLVLLCRRHHRCLHELGFGLARGVEGALAFTDPQGWPIHSHVRIFRAALRDAELAPAPWPITEADIDYDACLDALLQSRRPPTPDAARCVRP